MYQKFQTIVKLEENERANGTVIAQQQFRGLQTKARDGNSISEDWKLLLSRIPQNVNNVTHFENSAVKLSFGNEKVTKDNFTRLKQLGEPIVQPIVQPIKYCTLFFCAEFYYIFLNFFFHQISLDTYKQFKKGRKVKVPKTCTLTYNCKLEKIKSNL